MTNIVVSLRWQPASFMVVRMCAGSSRREATIRKSDCTIAITMAEGTPLPTTAQAEIEAGELRPAPKIFKETCEIDTRKTVAEVHNFVRGLSPYPAAWCNLTIGGTTYENVKVFATEKGHGPISLQCADGEISLTELQLPGKKRMAAKDLLNGLQNAHR